jgi:beta-galactosidase
MDPRNAEKEIRKGAGDKRDRAEKMWTTYDEKAYMCGYFVWTGFDYRGEPTPMRYPAISSQFGIMDYCGFRKDNFYYYQSWWGSEPVLHIFPHWNWAEKTGEAISVYCYSNMDEVELFVNNQSQGKQKNTKNWYLEWDDVIYHPGVLYAVGYKDGRELIKREVKTSGKPYGIELLPDRENICADGQDVSIITVRVVDQDRQLVPTADNLIFFDIQGAGSFLGVGNGNPGSHESDKRPLRRVFAGLCQLLIRSGFEEGDIKVEATGAELKKASCVILVKK